MKLRSYLYIFVMSMVGRNLGFNFNHRTSYVIREFYFWGSVDDNLISIRDTLYQSRPYCQLRGKFGLFP